MNSMITERDCCCESAMNCSADCHDNYCCAAADALAERIENRDPVITRLLNKFEPRSGLFLVLAAAKAL